MTRMIVALIMLGVIICTAHVTSAMVQDAIDSTCTALEKCTLKEENEEKYFLRIKEAIFLWKRSKKIIYLVMFCEDFSAIEENMIMLEILAENYDFYQIRHLCSETEMLLKNKKEDMNVSFENIFRP